MTTQFRDAAQAFRAGAESIFHGWTALELAVGQRFGGDQSSDVGREMFEVAFDLLTASSEPPSPTKLENLFYDGFDMLNTDVEDGSPEEVAAMLLRLRASCLAGDYSLASELVEKRHRLPQGGANSSQSAGDDKDIYGEPIDGPEALMASQGLEGDANPPHVARTREKPAPEIDEDGFELVQSRRRAP